MIRDFLLSSVLAHGFLDIFVMNRKLNILLLYLASIGTYRCFMLINPELGTLLFYILSCYHFGKDFQIITGERSGLVNWTGCYILCNTVEFTDGLKVWMKTLYLFGMSPMSSFFFLELITFLRLISIAAIFLSENKKLIIFSILSFLININLTVYHTIMLYMITIHVPLSLLQFYNRYGITPIKIWFSCSIGLTNLTWKFKIYKEIIPLIVSITMSHMILISLWQIKNNRRALN